MLMRLDPSKRATALMSLPRDLKVEIPGYGTDKLNATTDPSSVAEAEHVVLVVGTPVDEHLNPDPKFVLLAIEGLLDQLRDGQHVVLRSTVYPGVTAMVEKLLAVAKRTIGIAHEASRA